MEQQQEVQVEEGVNLLGIFKLLLSKIRVLVLVVLIGGILGGSFAVWQTYDINHYGTQVEFYINPETARDTTGENNSQYGVYGAYGKHVMDNMVKLLSSESFAELMILDGEDLPQRGAWATAKEEADHQLDEKLVAAAAALADLEEDQKDLQDLLEARAKNVKQLSKDKEALDNAWAGLYYTGKEIVQSPTFTEHAYRSSTISSITESDPNYPLVSDTKTAYETWSTLRDLIDQQEEDIEDWEELIYPKQDDTEDIVEEALEAWRCTAKYKEELQKYSEAVTFSYLQEDEITSDANNFARSFIYVEIFVVDDRGFADEVLDKIKTIVPDYVEKNMTVPSGYVGTNCKRITRTDDISLTNPGYTTKQAIKYGILAALVAFVVACIIVILVDRMDKRLRDTSILANQFNVPILGIIPSMEDSDKEYTDDKTKDEEGK